MAIFMYVSHSAAAVAVANPVHFDAAGLSNWRIYGACASALELREEGHQAAIVQYYPMGAAHYAGQNSTIGSTR